ncbi:XVIPCD domain-containing protein [Lysobacter hankyongensis]|uniref:X-Tfes XVIPCD domain-containing protein n=1 Tax=Lysobacter hankyongensis TaxID=1176535 RepID=A0ABP9AQJ4_9GAMM
MPDPKNDPVPEQALGSDPTTKPAGDPPLGFRTPLFGGTLSGSGRELSPGLFPGNADYVFRNGDLLGAHTKLRTDPAFAIDEYGLNGRFGVGNGSLFKFDALASPNAGTYRFGSNLQLGDSTFINADWNRSSIGQVYGADGAFKLGRDGNGTAQFRVDEPNGTVSAGTKLKFNDDFRLNADWSRTALGQVYGADGAFKLGQSGNGTAQFRVDESNGTASADTKLIFNDDFRLNADWSRTALGQVYGADGAFKLGRDGNGTAQFRIDEPNGTASADTKLKFNDDFRLNADWSRTALGQVYGADGAFKLGRDGNGTAQFRVDEPNGTSLFNTKLKFNDDFSLNGDYTNTRNGAIYGADGAFKLGQSGSGTAQFRVDEPNGTASADTKLKFNDDFRLNADWSRTALGQVYGADGAFKLGRDGNGTAQFRVDEPNGTASADTKLKFNDDFRLNADWSRTALGQVYGADGAFKLGRDGNGTAQFRVDEPNGTSLFNTKLKFNDDFSLNADYTNTRNGAIYGADGAFKLGKDGNGTAQFRIDEPAGTSMFNTKLKFNDGFGLNADYMNTKDGAIYGAESTFKLGKNGSGSGGFRVDEPANSASLNSKLLFGNGDTLNFDLARTPGGSVYGADGSFGIGRDGKGLASFRIDEPNGTSNYKLGASFANGNAFNAQVMADRLGTSLGFDAKLGFDKGAGSLTLDGKFGPKIDLGASINYKSKDLEYGGVVRADNASGAFRLSEFGAKVSTTGNDRYKFTAEAGYRPDTREAYGMVGLTISFGGGSRPSRPVTRASEPAFEPVARIDDAAANFREKQGVLLRPENRTLYEQAVAGVQKLNGEGAKLPVTETAASLTVLARQNGMDRIGYVALGNPTSAGQQNLFIGDGEPSNPSGKKAFVDRTQAATTPMDDNLRKLAGDAMQPNQANPVTTDPQAMSTGRRSAM